MSKEKSSIKEEGIALSTSSSVGASQIMSTIKFYDIATIRYEKESKKLKVTNASLRDERGKDYPTLAGMIGELYEDETDIQHCVENLVVEGIEDYLRYTYNEDKLFELTIELHLIDDNMEKDASCDMIIEYCS